jgi:predicted metal-dependent phosphoesterase TrpH
LRIKADLHVHTVFSRDAVITRLDLLYYAAKRGLTAVAITDHNCVEGAFKFAGEKDLLIIPGIEISSLHGHIIGLNVRELIPKGKSAAETVERIHEAGGLAVACHPYAGLKGSLRERVDEKFDAVETINSSAFPFKRSVGRAEEAARKFGLPRVAGTDAHYGPEIGYAFTLIEADSNADDVAEAISKGRCQPFGEPLPLKLKLERTVKTFKKKLEGKKRN